MKKRISAFVLSVVMLVLSACGGNDNNISDGTTNGDNTAESTTNVTLSGDSDVIQDGNIIIAEKGKASKFKIIIDGRATGDELKHISSIRTAIADKLDVKIDSKVDKFSKEESQYEIIINSEKRAECSDIIKTIKSNQYVIKSIVTDKKISIVIAYDGVNARYAAIQYFFENFVSDESLKIPVNTIISEKATLSMLVTNQYLRDPFVLLDNGVYYMYGTGWICSKNISSSLALGWTEPVNVVTVPEDCSGDQWAPEVYKYNDAYYMFATYKSKATGLRGTAVFKADNPMGPFVQVSNGFVTPKDKHSIDGTLYIDPDGQPWMVYCDEWPNDGCGDMACVKLSDDLTKAVSEPVHLFSSKDGSSTWEPSMVTDGPYLYTTESGSLLMIWSSGSKYGYCVAIARSESGKITGPWIHEKELLYSKALSGTDDGGHGMIFKDKDGNLYMAIHKANEWTDANPTKVTFIPLHEFDDTLVWTRY